MNTPKCRCGRPSKLTDEVADDLARPIAAGCHGCEQHRRDMAGRIALEWAILASDEQAAWLDRHAGDSCTNNRRCGGHRADLFAESLREVIDVALEDGRDVVGAAAELEARWPRRDR